MIAAVMIAALTGAPRITEGHIKIAAIISVIGPIVAMGIGYRAAFDPFPPEFGGQKVE